VNTILLSVAEDAHRERVFMISCSHCFGGKFAALLAQLHHFKTLTILILNEPSPGAG